LFHRLGISAIRVPRPIPSRFRETSILPVLFTRSYDRPSTFCTQMPIDGTGTAPPSHIMQGFTLLPTWLTSLVPSLKPKPRLQRDQFDYDPLPPPRLCPNRLPITRPSSPDSGTSSLDLVSTPQPRSLLLEFLPLETRQQIWSHVLGGHTLHLEIVGARLGCLHCLSADPSMCNIGRCIRRMGDRDISPPAVPEKAGKLLSLLKTCRQM
jgi:hypothetical protein